MRRVAMILAVIGALAGPVRAQTPAARPAPVEAPEARNQVVVLGDTSASETRERLHEILRQHPPSLETVLRLDQGLRVRPSTALMGDIKALLGPSSVALL